MVDYGVKDLMPHFVYCTNFKGAEDVEKLFLTKMGKYGIQSSILTMLTMQRMELITKEKAKKTAKGTLKQQYSMPRWEHNGVSINDDLDSLFHKFQNQEEIKNEAVPSFCTPKLTKEELQLVEQKDIEHMKTYFWNERADIDVEEMAKSDSKDKYLHTRCRRVTIQLTLKFLQQKLDQIMNELKSRKRKFNNL